MNAVVYCQLSTSCWSGIRACTHNHRCCGMFVTFFVNRFHKRILILSEYWCHMLLRRIKMNRMIAVSNCWGHEATLVWLSSSYMTILHVLQVLDYLLSINPTNFQKLSVVLFCFVLFCFVLSMACDPNRIPQNNNSHNLHYIHTGALLLRSYSSGFSTSVKKQLSVPPTAASEFFSAPPSGTNRCLHYLLMPLSFFRYLPTPY